MKRLYLYLIIILVAPVILRAQTIGVTPGLAKVNDAVLLDIRFNEHDDKVYSVVSDFELKSKRFYKDTIINMGAIKEERIYNFQVSFDTLTRYYQSYIAMAFASNATVNNHFERPYFRFPGKAVGLMSQLDALVAGLAADAGNIPRVNYIISFKLYDHDEMSCNVVYGQYTTANDLGAVRTFLKGHIEQRVTDSILKKLLNEMVSAPPVVGSLNRYPALATTAFTEIAAGENVKIFSIRSNDSITIYIKPI